MRTYTGDQMTYYTKQRRRFTRKYALKHGHKTVVEAYRAHGLDRHVDATEYFASLCPLCAATRACDLRFGS